MCHAPNVSALPGPGKLSPPSKEEKWVLFSSVSYVGEGYISKEENMFSTYVT